MPATLPPGPRTPALMQTIGWWHRPTAYMERLRARHGGRFTLRLLMQSPFVMLTDPADVREVFTQPADVLHPGEGARILEPVVGAHSVILLDEDRHMSQRKLLLPAFHGDRMSKLTGLMQELTEREIASWPTGEPVKLHPRVQALTLEIILRAVFGLDEGERLEALRPRLTAMLAFGDDPFSLMPELRSWPLLGRRFEAFERDRAEADRLLFELIAERRATGGEDREDVLSMLIGATHEDGWPMSDEEIRDELLTALVAGHETTASSLGFAFEQLARMPGLQERLAGDGEEAEALRAATINETLRHRPVLPLAAPRLVKQEVTIGGHTYPPGVALICSTYLVHHDPEIYPEPHAFRPERWLGVKPGTYTFLPFGGGRRRCIGASFAQLEMKVVLRAALERYELRPAAARREPVRRRMITITPGDGARVVLARRSRAATGPEPAAIAA